jgi:hypothetical protein
LLQCNKKAQAWLSACAFFIFWSLWQIAARANRLA